MFEHCDIAVELHVAQEDLPVAFRRSDALERIALGWLVVVAIFLAEAVDDDDLDHPATLAAFGLVERGTDGVVVEHDVDLIPTVLTCLTLRVVVASRLEVFKAFTKLGLEREQRLADVTLATHELVELSPRDCVVVVQRFDPLLHGRRVCQRCHQLSARVLSSQIPYGTILLYYIIDILSIDGAVTTGVNCRLPWVLRGTGGEVIITRPDWCQEITELLPPHRALPNARLAAELHRSQALLQL